MPEYPLGLAPVPSGPSLASYFNLPNVIGNLPTVFRQAQLDQASVADAQRGQALQQALASVPPLPDGAPDYITQYKVAQRIDPQAAFKIAPLAEQQIFQKQIQGGGAPGAPSAAPGPGAAVTPGAAPTSADPYFDRLAAGFRVRDASDKAANIKFTTTTFRPGRRRHSVAG